MDPRAVELLRTGGGLARRRDLLAAGAGRRELARLVRTGQLRETAPHVLAVAGAPEQAERAVALSIGGTLSHESAARAHGLELMTEPAAVHVTVGRDRSRAARQGAVVHRADLGTEDVDVVLGVRRTTLMRTLLDLARSRALAVSVPVLDSALRTGAVTVEELTGAVLRLPPGPGRRRAVRAAELVDPLAASVLESACRVLLVLAGVAPRVTQHVVRHAGRFVARVDFAWPELRLAVETDGFAWHSDRDRYRQDRRRGNALVLASWTVLRFSCEDVVGSPERVVEQVRQALGAAAA